MTRCCCGIIVNVELPYVTRETRHTATICEPIADGGRGQHECAVHGCRGMACNWRGTPHAEWRCDPHLGKQGEGRKDDALKTRYDLLPWRGLDAVAQVLTKGAEKYAPDNWRKVEGWRWRYFRAAVGHLMKWWGGEKLDPEWGLPHLAHAACCVLFLLELDQ